jgi:hypothetical protein
MIVTNENHTILAIFGLEKIFKSRNQPQKMLAAVAAMPLVRAPSARDRTEKYLVR